MTWALFVSTAGLKLQIAVFENFEKSMIIYNENCNAVLSNTDLFLHVL